MAGQFGRFQPPACRCQYCPAVPQTWKKRHRRGGAPVEDGDLRALGAGQFGEEPHQWWGVGAQVQRVHSNNLHAVASLRDGEVHAAAVAPHSQVLRSEDGVLRDAVLLKADHSGQDLWGASDVGALGEQRRERELRGHGVAICGREVGKLCAQGIPVGGSQHAEESTRGDADTTGHAHDLQPEPPALQLLQVGRVHSHPDLQVRRQPRLVGTHVQRLNLFVREDHFVTAVERGGLSQSYEGVIPTGDAGLACAGRSAWVAVGIAGATVRHGLLERHHRADAVPLVEALVVLLPGGGPVRADAQAGQDESGALDLSGDRFRQNEPRIQAEVERDGVATQARDEVSHPRRDAVPAAVRGALLQARPDGVEFAYGLGDRGEAAGCRSRRVGPPDTRGHRSRCSERAGP